MIAAEQQPSTLLRFITCGSMNDGKTTLIERLQRDTKLLFDYHTAALERDLRKDATQSNAVHFARLVEGLQPELEQGLTTYVAYRFFTTAQRRFAVADMPGHDQYTLNMATGASTAQLAVLLVDARKGLLTQTKRDSRIVRLLGVP